jgi:hypothetical protein
MPRLGGGAFGQSYLINLSDDSQDATSSDNEQIIEAAPTSAPRANAQSPVPASILRNGSNDSSGLSPRRGHQVAMELPTTVSHEEPIARISNRTQVRAAESATPALTPRLRRQVAMDLPTTVSNEAEQIPQRSNRIKVRAAESAGTSFTPGNRRRRDGMQLPTTSRVVSDSDAMHSAPAKKQVWRAAEAGSSPVLPEFVPSPSSNHRRRRPAPAKRGPPDRAKTRSTPSLRKMVLRGMNGGNSPALPQTQQDTPPPIPKQSRIANGGGALRRRTASTTGSDDEDLISWRSRDTDSPYRFTRSRKHGTLYNLKNLSRMKVGHILQFFIVLAVTLLVYESHSKAIFAADQLSQFKEEESLLLLHLQKIEQQSIQLHENLSRLAQSGGAIEPVVEKKSENGDVDFDLIHKQTQQLYQMEEELNHEVRTLQSKIQQSARNHIIQEFGEGPVQVILELDFGGEDGPNQISILLWHDTPHAAWTWLEQIRRHIWDDAEFKWQQSHIIDAIPTRNDRKGGRIEFVEQSQHGHEPWTVGLRESDVGDLQMYFNLQDNVNIHKHEVCVGKVIDGFDSLQHLLEISRNRKSDDNYSIQIRKATAMHVTKIENI